MDPCDELRYSRRSHWNSYFPLESSWGTQYHLIPHEYLPEVDLQENNCGRSKRAVNLKLLTSSMKSAIVWLYTNYISKPGIVSLISGEPEGKS